MIKIAICDDEVYQLDTTFNLLSTILNEESIDIDMLKFTSSLELLNFLHDNESYFDIVFLDIVMDGINGIDLAKFIRKSDSFVNIIFTTTSKDYLLDGYDVNATSYLLKPIIYKKIKDVILNCIDNITEKTNNFFCVKINKNIYKLNLKDIIYFESSLRKIIIHRENNDNFVFHNKLDKVETEFDITNFVRCHKSYLVNLNYVKEIKNSNLITKNNSKIPISRTYLNSTKESFLDYFTKRT